MRHDHIDSRPVPTELAGLSIEQEIFCLSGVRTAALEAILLGHGSILIPWKSTNVGTAIINQPHF